MHFIQPSSPGVVKHDCNNAARGDKLTRGAMIPMIQILVDKPRIYICSLQAFAADGQEGYGWEAEGDPCVRWVIIERDAI